MNKLRLYARFSSFCAAKLGAGLSRAFLANLAILLVVLLVSACDGNYLVWSSDGKLGAAIGAKGLRICDSEAGISPVLMDNAGMFRWIPQEHMGVVVGYDYVASWTELKPLLTAEQNKQIQEESVKLKRKIYTYHGDNKKFADNALRTFNYPLEAALLLRHSAQPDIEKLARQKWPAYSVIKVPVFFIKLVQVENNASVKQVRTLNRGIDEVVELRPSPGAKFIACVKHENAQERNYIDLIPVAAFAKPVMLAVNTNCYPDWSADGRCLYYSRGNTAEEPDLLRGQGVHEGGLFKAEIVDAAGKLNTSVKSQKLAKIIFDNRAPVRALKDNRVLFVSREIKLPSSVSANGNSVLFALDGSKVDLVLRRNDELNYFDISPDQDQIAATTSGGVLLVAKSNGSDPVELCNGKDLRVSGILPQWKNNQELSYGTEIPGPRGAKPAYSVLLWSRSSAAPKDLSKAWGKEAAQEIIVHRDIFQDAMSGVVADIDKKQNQHK